MSKNETGLDRARATDAPAVARSKGVAARRALAPTVFCPSAEVDRCVRQSRRTGKSQ